MDHNPWIGMEDLWKSILGPSPIPTHYRSRTLTIPISGDLYSDLDLKRSSLSPTYKYPCSIAHTEKCAGVLQGRFDRT